MLNIHQEFPNYAFDKHAGYPTKSHIKAICDFEFVLIIVKHFNQ